mmetsp:Transcript_37767/g.98501  ORF Transcript_37767/g.98501 Transcript_37767/m.98501 type:complete len:204 (+) Transcript_37767:500-1111(+)
MQLSSPFAQPGVSAQGPAPGGGPPLGGAAVGSSLFGGATVGLSWRRRHPQSRSAAASSGMPSAHRSSRPTPQPAWSAASAAEKQACPKLLQYASQLRRSPGSRSETRCTQTPQLAVPAAEGQAEKSKHCRGPSSSWGAPSASCCACRGPSSSWGAPSASSSARQPQIMPLELVGRSGMSSSHWSSRSTSQRSRPSGSALLSAA